MDQKDRKIGKHTHISLRTMTAVTLAVMILLSSCGAEPAAQTEETTEPTVSYTVPADGDTENETCKGSYTVSFDADAAVAQVGTEELTNGELNVFYKLAVNSFHPEAGLPQPDFSIPLEGQNIGSEDITWQQFFLRQALDSWHTFQALQQHSLEQWLRDEAYFAPDPKLHEEYMKDMPVNDILYTMDRTFVPNKMHQEFLDGIPDMLLTQAEKLGYWNTEEMLAAEFGEGVSEEALQQAVWIANYAYMYYTEHSWYEEPSQEDVEQTIQNGNEAVVDIRHIFLDPEYIKPQKEGQELTDSDRWKMCEDWTAELMGQWSHGRKQESIFANMAHEESRDAASYLNGGFYGNIHEGQLIEPLNEWCFDPEREIGDVGAVKSDLGWHILYLADRRDAGYEEALSELRREAMEPLVQEAREKYPMTVSYDQITLLPVSGKGKLTLREHLLYPDIAHERFSEVPVYLQQDYRLAPYGGYRVGTHGCGITSLAMLATYMSDTLLTPGMLAARYGGYNSEHGTDAQIFYRTPPDMGFYTYSRVYNFDDALQALSEGRKVVNLQQKGYFTRGGHYLVLSELDEDGNIVIRDSNIYNYRRLKEHAVDAFPQSRIPPNSQGFYVFEYKILNIPFCSRCAEAGVHTNSSEKSLILTEDYICPKCRTAMDRRNTFLDLSGLN